MLPNDGSMTFLSIHVSEHIYGQSIKTLKSTNKFEKYKNR